MSVPAPNHGMGSRSGLAVAPTHVANDKKHPGIQSRIGTRCQEFLLYVFFSEYSSVQEETSVLSVLDTLCLFLAWVLI